MYKVKRETKKFNTDRPEELEEYDMILNNPLCSIISERREKISESDIDMDAKITTKREYVILVVTWEERELF